VPDSQSPLFVLATPEPALLAALEPVLAETGARIERVLSAQAVLESIDPAEPPGLLLLDADLPGMPLNHLLARVAERWDRRPFPIVLFAGAVTAECIDRLAEGAIDDLILQSEESSYWQLRIELALRAFRQAREMEALREAAALHAQFDRLTGVYHREALLAMLFRETDRVQRQSSSMSLLLFDMDDFGHWNARLGTEICDDLLCQVAARTSRLLRSYDLLGRPGMDEFLVALPSCGVVHAVLLAERLRIEVFGVPFRSGHECVRLSACFGIASSQGRSPVVVLREAEEALESAKNGGAESIECFEGCPRPQRDAVTYLSSATGDELLAW
jgi:two-component system, cell cycle response regulator